MNDDEAVERLRDLQASYGGDTEALHSYADEFLCEVLRENGYPRLVEAFLALNRWYA